jgi:hypothetical protein
MKTEKSKKLKVIKKETKLNAKQNIKWFKKPLSIAGFVLLALVISLLIARPKIIQGELNWDYILNKIEQHDKQIADLEQKQDNTQTQTDQNTQDIQNTQNQVDNIQQQTTKNTDDINNLEEKVNTPAPTPEPIPDPNNSWTNSHGSFVYKNIGSIMPMYTGKDAYVYFNYSTSACDGFKQGVNNLIPANTKIVSPSTTGGYCRSGKCFDLSSYFQAKCGKTTPYYFSYEFSSDPTQPAWPGNFDLWW